MGGLERRLASGRRCSPGFLIAGVGIGMTNPAIASTAVGVVPPGAKAGMASGINNTFRQVGIATGVAALGAIFQHEIDSRARRRRPQAPREAGRGGRLQRHRAGRRRRPAAVPDRPSHAASDAFVGSLTRSC